MQGVRIAGQQNGVTYISCKCKIVFRQKSFIIVAPVPGPREKSKSFGNFSQIWWHWASSPTLRISLSAVKQRLLKNVDLEEIKNIVNGNNLDCRSNL